MKSKSPVEFSGELYQLAREAMERQQFDVAAALFRCSVELRPHSKSLELLGECLLALPNRTSESIVFLAAAAGLGNRSFRSFFLLAQALTRQGEIPDAIEKLDIAIEMQPQFKAAVELRNELQNRAQEPSGKS